ncbi:alpha/beta hydrolase [Kaarinaea lacus]
MSIDFNDSSRPELRLYDGLEEAPCSAEHFLIPGPVGGLEAVMACPDERESMSPIAIICHPHPLYGGSMANKVVHMVANTFKEIGLPTLRFNFRGVGHSQGRFDQGRGEVQDLVAVCEWFKQRYPEAPLWLAGFSFGSYIAFQAHNQVNAQRLLLIAPPVTRFDFNADAQIQIPWMVIQGGKDEIVEPEKVSAWVLRQGNTVSYEWLADAGHFFHGRLNHIREAIKQHWS